MCVRVCGLTSELLETCIYCTFYCSDCLSDFDDKISFMFVFISFLAPDTSNRYASIRAIETKSVVDDQQWLTYWILYSMITLFELTFAKIIEW